MPIVKLTGFFFTDDGWGWSESHHVDGGSVINSLAPFLNVWSGILQNQRRPMLGTNAYIMGARASYRTSTGKIAAAPQRYTPPLRGTQTFNQVATDECAPALAAKLRMGNTGQTAFSDIYLRGFWDEVELREELHFETALGAKWKQLADAYTTALLAAAYGWEGIDEALTRRGPVTNYDIQPDGRCLFSVQIDSGPAMPATGTKTQIRVARLNNSSSALNTTHVVTVAGPTTLLTVIPTAAGPFTGLGSYVMAGKGFIQYAAAQYYVLARRKEGRPTFNSPGRSRVRARS
jgi:hypothetical protein